MNLIGPVPISNIWITFAALSSFLLSALTLAVALICMLRVEDRLRTTLKLLAIAAGIRLVFKALGILGLSTLPNWSNISALFHSAMDIFLLLAFLEVYKIIKSLNKKAETKKPQQR